MTNPVSRNKKNFRMGMKANI